MQRKWLRNKGGTVALVLSLAFLLGLLLALPVAAQENLVRSCSGIEGTQLITPRVVTGYDTSFALRQDQKLWGWGRDNNGEVGNGKIIEGDSGYNGQETPDLITTEGFNGGFKQIAAGEWHTLGLKNDGTVWGWGDNESDWQLGQMAKTRHSTPQLIPGLENIEAIACGRFFSMALDSDGYVWAWGNNASRALARGKEGSSYNNPERVKGPEGVGYLDNVAAIACGRYHVLAIKRDGTLWAWGDSFVGALGDGSVSDGSYPVQVSLLSGVKSVAAGNGFSLAIKNDGTVWAWGSRYWATLGDGESEGYVDVPQKVKGLYGLGQLSGVKTIACGDCHSLALHNDGTIYAWGENYGRLGNGEGDASTTPIKADISGVVDIAAGNSHSLALKNDGTVWGWGDNFLCQLGVDSQGNNLPVRVEGVPLLARPLVGLNMRAADGSGSAQLLTCFKSDTTGYKLTVENPLEAVKITPTPVAGATAVVKLNGVVAEDGVVNLALDPARNLVEVVVSEPGKDDLTYNIDIKRLRLADPLTGLSVKGKADGSGSEYLTGFAGAVNDYRVIVENAVDVVKVAPSTIAGADAAVKLNNAVQTGGVVNLNTGWNLVTVQVTQPERTNRAYTINIGRTPSWQQGFEDWPVAADKSWNIQFSQPVNTETAGDNIYVLDAGGNRVAVNLNWSPDKKKVTVQPQSNYNAGASYVLRVDTALQDARGTALKTAVVMPFKIT